MVSEYARNTDPETSHDAADALGDDALSNLHRKVIEALAAHGPLTVPEIAALYGIPRDTISPRMKTLVAKRLVRDSGYKKNPPGHNRMCIVWELP